MKKLAEVEAAKALMTEAVEWSVMKWLREKKRVRKAADEANNALWARQKQIKATWGEELKQAYEALGDAGGKANAHATSLDLKQLAKRVKQADEEADRAHNDAEETFDRAEKILSTSMAREGCRQAILSWELYEKAITAAEAGSRKTAAK